MKSLFPRIHTAIIALPIVMFLCVVASCNSHNNRQTPKPEGWHRIEIPSAEFNSYKLGGIEMEFNSVATVESKNSDRNLWIDVVYPQFHGSRIYLTLNHTNSRDELLATIANRTERMTLNNGGAVTELTELKSDGGWNCLMTVARTSPTTPIQILANDDNHVISGALYFNFGPTTAPDSVAPIVDTIERDLLHTLKHIRTSKP